ISPTSTSTNVIPVMIRIAVNMVSIGWAKVEPWGGSHQCMDVSLFRREREVCGLRIAARHRHRRRLHPVLLVPRLERVDPRRQARDAEGALGARGCEER